MVKIISTINFKGGVAKTTSTINIGAEIARRGKKVLLIDADPQANLTVGLGIEPDENNNIYISLSEGSFSAPINVSENLDVIPSHISFVDAEIQFSTKLGREFLLKNLVDQVKNNYDYIIIDCPPSSGLIFINAVACSDRLLIPLLGEPFSVSGIKELMSTVTLVQKTVNKNLKIGGVFLTKYENVNLHKESKEAMTEFFKEKFLKTQIRKNISISEAQTMGIDVVSYKPQSNGAEDYINLTNEVLNIK